MAMTTVAKIKLGTENAAVAKYRIVDGKYSCGQNKAVDRKYSCSKKMKLQYSVEKIMLWPESTTAAVHRAVAKKKKKLWAEDRTVAKIKLCAENTAVPQNKAMAILWQWIK